VLMVGRTRDTLKRNVIDPLTEILGPEKVQLRTGAGEATILGRVVYIVGAADERASDKLRGLSVVGAYADEITTFPESFFKMLLSRLRIDGAKLFATTNPDSKAHWLYRDYLERASLHVTSDGEIVRKFGSDVLEQLARFSFRLEDNPNLPPYYVESIKQEYTGLWYKRFIEGQWVVAEGAIFDMFDQDRHVVSELPPISYFPAVGVDYGTTNPFAAVLIGLGTDRKLYACREFRYDSKKVKKQKTDAEYSQDLKSWLDSFDLLDTHGWKATPRFLCIDPSATSFRVQCQEDGLRVIAKADNKVLDGIRTVSSLFANGQLLIHESCPELINELSTYSWDPTAVLHGHDAPMKVNDHSTDALRYAIQTTKSRWRWEVNTQAQR